MKWDEDEEIRKRIEKRTDVIRTLNFTTLTNHLKNTKENNENNVKQNEDEDEKKNVDMIIMTSVIKNIYILQKKYYSKAIWSRNRKGKRKIKSTIIILAEKQLLHEISQILKSFELFIITNDRLFIIMWKSSNENQSKFELLIF